MKLTDEQLVDELFKLKESWKHENENKFLRVYPKPMIHIMDAMFRHHSEVEQEAKRWKAVAVYLAECHAANAEGVTPNRLSKYDKGRFKEILVKAVSYLKGEWPHSCGVQVQEEKTIERCQKGIERFGE